jgi:hypothetical protein
VRQPVSKRKTPEPSSDMALAPTTPIKEKKLKITEHSSEGEDDILGDELEPLPSGFSGGAESSDSENSPLVQKSKRAYKSAASPININALGSLQYSGLRAVPAIGAQGEHSLAHIIFVELAYSALKGNKVRLDAASKIIENFKPLALSKATEGALYSSLKRVNKIMEELPQEDRKAEQQNIVESLKVINELHENRENIVEAVKAIADGEKSQKLLSVMDRLERCKPVNVRKIVQHIKDGYRARLAPVLEDVANELISGANKMAHTSFPSEGLKKPIKNKKGGEAHAKNYLAKTSEFLLNINQKRQSVFDMKSNKENRRELASEIKSQEEEIINEASNLGFTSDVVDNFLDKKRETKTVIESSREFYSRVATEMNNLFFYPKVAKENLIDLQSAEDSAMWEAIKSKKGYTKDAMPRNNDLETLFHVTARSIVALMTCFEGLETLDTQRLVRGFLNQVLSKQGWGSAIEGEALKLKDFEKGISRYANFDYENGKFSMISQDSFLAQELSSSSSAATVLPVLKLDFDFSLSSVSPEKSPAEFDSDSGFSEMETVFDDPCIGDCDIPKFPLSSISDASASSAFAVNTAELTLI